jgi:thymidylate synthase (FAD)
MGNDLSVVRAARVSYNAEWRTGENKNSDERLIKYLWRNQHTSPFESVTFTFEVKAPIFVFRQWMRHRTWSFNEVSARYTELPEEFYVPKLEHIGTQSKDNKQGRDITALSENRLENYDLQTTLLAYEESCENSFKEYKYLLECGWPRELARCVLPLSTYSHMFTTVDLLNLLKFITLREHNHAQFEIQEYAKAVLELIRPIVPVCVKAWEENK